MKEKNFNYTSLYLYDRDLVDELERDFIESGIRSKSQYLTHLIGLGLQTRKNGNTETANMDNITREITEIKRALLSLQHSFLKEHVPNSAYQILLCNMNYLIECLLFGDEVNFVAWERGDFDGLPDRIATIYERLKEEANIA
ncbi:MAG: hypothetical protein J6C93_07850 [Clostridia bacterium]|nr:hypothetical protein [Clostridia bacterium]